MFATNNINLQYTTNTLETDQVMSTKKNHWDSQIHPTKRQVAFHMTGTDKNPYHANHAYQKC